LNYIASGRPVLVFGEGGEGASLVQELDAGVVITADADALEGALDSIVNGTFGPERVNGIDQWLAENSRTAMAERYFQGLDRLTDASNKG
jgi:glycosyltransferase involved in cell wall biosynthesis